MFANGKLMVNSSGFVGKLGKCRLIIQEMRPVWGCEERSGIVLFVSTSV